VVIIINKLFGRLSNFFLPPVSKGKNVKILEIVIVVIFSHGQYLLRPLPQADKDDFK